jgi:hypothetical protein|tara:strand:- start:184 stop:384 length:201 start_codon:yes stop_codon:yes gene_type:complete
MAVKSYYARGSHFGRVMMMCGNYTKAAAEKIFWKIHVSTKEYIYGHTTTTTRRQRKEHTNARRGVP